MARDKDLHVGDGVSWHTSQGVTHGKVQKRLTSPTKIKSHKISASKENPEYLVKSDKTGNEAAHRAEALIKDSGN